MTSEKLEITGAFLTFGKAIGDGWIVVLIGTLEGLIFRLLVLATE